MDPTGTNPDARRTAPAAGRNRDPILQQLLLWLPDTGTVLEIASGTGQHVAHFAAALPRLRWLPSDPDAGCRASIAAWTAGLPNVAPALDVDAARPPWDVAPADAVLCINMIHIAPPAATAGLLAGAAAALGPGGLLLLYGPFRQAGQVPGPGNAAFDADLRARNPDWGLRVLGEVAAAATAAGFGPPTTEAMPANNLFVAFRRQASR